MLSGSLDLGLGVDDQHESVLYLLKDVSQSLSFPLGRLCQQVLLAGQGGHAEDMAQWIMCSLYKREDRVWIPSPHIKRWACKYTPGILVRG